MKNTLLGLGIILMTTSTATGQSHISRDFNQQPEDEVALYMFHPLIFDLEDVSINKDSLFKRLQSIKQPRIDVSAITIPDVSSEFHEELLKTVSKSIADKHLIRDNMHFLLTGGKLEPLEYLEGGNHLTNDLVHVDRISSMIGTYKTKNVVVTDSVGVPNSILVKEGVYNVTYRRLKDEKLEKKIQPNGIYDGPCEELKENSQYSSMPFTVNALEFLEKWTLDSKGFSKEIKGYYLPSDGISQNFCYASEDAGLGRLVRSGVTYVVPISVPRYSRGSSGPFKLEKISYYNGFIIELLTNCKQGYYEMYDMERICKNDMDLFGDLKAMDALIRKKNFKPDSWHSLMSNKKSGTSFFHESEKYDSTALGVLNEQGEWELSPEDLDENGNAKVYEAYAIGPIDWKKQLVGIRFLEDWYMDESLGIFRKKVRGMHLVFKLSDPCLGPNEKRTREVYIRFRD